MDLGLRGRRVLVTGGTRGIGAAIAKSFVAEGAQVVVTGRKSSKTDNRADGEDSLRFECVDFEDEAATQDYAHSLRSRGFDVLVNNAGINKVALAGEVDLVDWDRIQRVNLRAPLVLARALVPGMAARKWGRMVNIASIFASVSRAGRVAYTSSKAGLVGMTRTLALDYAADNVLVNAVGPGFIDTEMTRTILSEEQRRELISRVPIQRMGEPCEVAKLVVFLASDANSMITGQHLIADGGFTSQ